MDRRDFNKGLLSVGASSPLILNPSLTLANQSGDDKDGAVASLARIQLQFATAVILLTSLVILINKGTMGYNLQNPVPRFPVNRADTSKIPIFGSHTRPPVSSYLGVSQVIGKLYLLGTLLILVPLTMSLILPKRTILTHREWEYEPKGAPKKLRLSSPLTADMAAKGRLVGEARLAQDVLLLLVGSSYLK